MGVFPRIGGLINLNTQQPLKAESERSENVKSKSVSEEDTSNNAPSKEKVYYDKDEEKKQTNLWHEAEKKHKWLDAPPKVKVTTEKGLCHMNIEFTVGITPNGVYELLAYPDSGAFYDFKERRDLMKNKSSKVLMEDGPRKITKFENTVTWDIRGWSIDVPIKLILDENKKDLTGKYKKDKLTLMFMKVFEGKWKVEPMYVDSERLCKNRLPKSREEYIKCSNGQGKIASKVIIDQYFQPYLLFNLPPLSWYIQEIIINTTKTLLKTLQDTAKLFREAGQG